MEPLQYDYDYKSAKDTLLVGWIFGSNCNYACSYCPEYFHDKLIENKDYDKVISFCDKAIEYSEKLNKKICFEFTGGETTLSVFFKDMIRYLKEKGSLVYLISNGSRSLKFWSEVSPYLDHIVISYHSEFGEIDHFIKVAQLLSDSMLVHANFMMKPDRFDEVYGNAMRFIDETRDVTVALQPLFVKLCLSDEMYEYTNAQLTILNEQIRLKNVSEGFNDRIRNTKIRGAMAVTSADKSVTVMGSVDIQVRNMNRWNGWLCNAGVDNVYVDLDGYVYRGYCRQGGALGHFTDKTINFPYEPIVCRAEVCLNQLDMLVWKKRLL